MNVPFSTAADVTSSRSDSALGSDCAVDKRHPRSNTSSARALALDEAASQNLLQTSTFSARLAFGQPVDREEEGVMDEKLWASLPQALVEEVLARLPLKKLFQCRVLSRAWRWTGGAPWANTIASVSANWPAFSPVYLQKDGLVGYNGASGAWETVFDLKAFPSVPEGVGSVTLTSCAGSLVCFAEGDFSTDSMVHDGSAGSGSHHQQPLDYEIRVVNVVTGQCAMLPPRPNMRRPGIMHLIPVGASAYALILLTQVDHAAEGLGSCAATTMVTQIYTSTTRSWTEKSSRTVLPKWRTSLSNFVYLDGVFYIATGSSAPGDPPLLLIHHVERGSWITVIPPLPVQLRKLVRYHVLHCGSELILVARLLPDLCGGEAAEEPFYRDALVRNHSFLIFKLDLGTGEIKEVSRCPWEKLVGVTIDQVLAFGDCIYFGGRYTPRTSMMMYNVRTRKWTYHTSAWEMPKAQTRPVNGSCCSFRETELFYWTPSALRPGLNPFAEL